MNYTETNGNQMGYYEFLHFCHLDTPYESVEVLYLIAIKAKIPLPSSTPSHAWIWNFLNWIMNCDKTNRNQPGYYEFLHFCHIGMPYGSIDVFYLIAIVAKSYPTPSIPSKAYLNFQKFWSGWWIMIRQMGIRLDIIIFYTFATLIHPTISRCPL